MNRVDVIRREGIPLMVKLGYTAYMAVLVPVYLANYGAANFLYFCDLALLLTLAGVWLESSLLVSMPAVGILAPQAVWVIDYLANLAGVSLTGMTDYMFDARKPAFLRGLSLFHGWLPFLLVYLVGRLGYDRRAFPAWTGLATIVLIVCFAALPAPSPATADIVANVNYVYGMSQTAPQTWVAPLAWLTLLIVGLPLVMYWPTHIVLMRWRGMGPCGAPA